MELNKFKVALYLFALPATEVYSAALDRSGQSVAAFLQPNNYFEAGGTILDPNIKGKEAGISKTRQKISNLGKDAYVISAAIKLQASDNFSFGILYDQPFGMDTEYKGNNSYVVNSESGEKGTKANVNSQNISMLFGFQPDNKTNIYAGVVYQNINGSVGLQGANFSIFNGYEADIKNSSGIGWIAGIAYEIKEISLKTSLTYRSEINHKVQVNENIPLLAGIPNLHKLVEFSNERTKLTTPQSINLDLQTGIQKNTIVFTNIRWVNWKDSPIQPYKFGKVAEGIGSTVGRAEGFNFSDFYKNQLSITSGVGLKLNDQWASSLSIGWDSGTGTPVGVFGPINGYWNIGMNVRYSPTPNTFIAAGIKYFWLGDAKAQTASQFGGNDYVSKFEDSNAIGYGLKIGYTF
ncbi:outer membrane protein transport protein [Acinetobacter gyllenbergii]|uniref:OmpP1/FadL family transporter n=1 Tax=Acinetobacter gyllenbergii TaxID=134534 RepID=UPI0021CE3B9F|nr:outer membrane protein transport protein [Acinetobacter gyllenbergii]MCU4582504.1 outer membrane protein transport protein [Acinetobacter gyllenbergii]